MRWGEPNKVPPLTRSRGMFAASSLVVAVLATYASVAVLSLSAAAPFSIVGHLPGVHALVKGIGWDSQGRPSMPVAKLDPRRSFRAAVFADVSFVALRPKSLVPHAQELSITNTTRKAAPAPPCRHRARTRERHRAVLRIGLTTTACRWPGPPRHPDDQSDAGRPDQREPRDRHLRLELRAAPEGFTITGAQAPLPPTALIATPAAGGRSTCRGRRRGSSRRRRVHRPGAPSGLGAFQQVGGVTHWHDAWSTRRAPTARTPTGRPRSRGYRGAGDQRSGPGRRPRRPTRLRPDAPARSTRRSSSTAATGNSMSMPVDLATNSVAERHDHGDADRPDPASTVTGQANGGQRDRPASRSRRPAISSPRTARSTVTATATDSRRQRQHRDPERQRDHEGHRSAGRPHDLGEPDMITQANGTTRADPSRRLRRPTAPTSSRPAVGRCERHDHARPRSRDRRRRRRLGRRERVEPDRRPDITVTAWSPTRRGTSRQGAERRRSSQGHDAPAAPTSIGVAAGPEQPG